MLVLDRKLYERVIIGDDVEVTVCKISARNPAVSRVKLGINAPRSIRISRLPPATDSVRKEIETLLPVSLLSLAVVALAQSHSDLSGRLEYFLKFADN